MIMRYHHLTQQPNVFYAVTGLGITEFDDLLGDVLPVYAQTDRNHRQHHTPRVVAIAGSVNRQLAHRMPA